MIDPPGPPLPPSGPPSGLNFSRWTEATPLPPRPPTTCSVTRSTNVGTAMGGSFSRVERVETRKAPLKLQERPRWWCWVSGGGSLPRREDVDDATAPLGAELDVARHQGEQRVVA